MLKEFLKEPWVIKLYSALITIIISFLLYHIISRIINRNLDNKKSKLFNNKKSKTIIRLLKSIIRYIMVIITIIVVLKIYGVDVSSMLTGIGIIGIIIGFAIQDALKDIIKGIDIIVDSYYQVGDVIKYNNITGKVLAIGLKTTKVEDIYSLNIVSISNRNIEQVEVLSTLFCIEVPIPYEVSVEDAEKAIKDIVKDIKKDNDVMECEYKGVNKLEASSINYLIKINCDPLKRLQVRRDAIRSVLVGLRNNNIEVPYTQIDIHQK